MKRLIVGVALASASLLAFADGPQQQYEQAAVNQAALDPNEALVNDDGAMENPSAKMSGTARAYRNGYYNGKHAQRDQDEQTNSPPPLPPGYPGQAAPPPHVVTQDDQSHYTSIPPQPGIWAQAGDAYAGVQPAPRPAPRAYVQRDEGYGYAGRAIQPAQQYAPPAPPVNVYVQAPQPVYAPRPEPTYTQVPPEAYEPPPGPPDVTYVVMPHVPPALATGYWPAYRPMYRRPPVYYYRGW